MASTANLSDLLETIAQRSSKTVDDSNLRIQQGQRIVYGQLASGELRSELTADQINAIASAIQQTQTPNIDATIYGRKVPSLEIQIDKQTVFRQERDGVISVNELQLAQEVSDADYLWETAVAAEPEPVAMPEPIDTPMMVGALESIMNPLAYSSSEATTANLGGYEIQQEGDRLTVAKEGMAWLSFVDGQIEHPDMVQEELLRPLRELVTIQAIAQGLVDGFEWMQASSADLVDQLPDSDAQTPNYPATNYYRAVAVEPPQGIEPQRKPTDYLQTLFDRLPAGNNRSFWVTLVGDLEQATKMAQQIGHSELRQIAKVTQQAAQTIRQVLDNEQFQATQQTITQKLQEGLIWGAEHTGRGIESAGKWAQRAGQWLADRPQAIREQRAATIALSIFEAGFERTQEHSYQKRGLTVSFQGRNTFTLRDADGEVLLKFKAEKSLSGEPQITITGKGNFERSHYHVLEEIRQDKGIVQGSLQAEAHHAQRSQQIGALAKHLAEAIGTNTHEGKHYRIVSEPACLRIFAKDGRGEIFSQEGGEVTSRLIQRDFARFEQLTRQRQSAQQAEVG